MGTEKERAPDLMKGVPRGLQHKFLKDQKLPMAAWQSTDALLAHEPFRYDPKEPNGKILMGAIGEHLIGIRDERHAASCAGSRGGKSITMTANLFFYDGSVLVIDPKHEHAEATAEARAKRGQIVRILAPYRSSGIFKKYGARYNPLKTLILEAESVIEDAKQIVDAIVITSGDERDPHWSESAADFLLGLILYVAFGSNVADKDRHLITVRRLIKNAKKAVRIDEKTSDYKLIGEVLRGIGHLRDGPNEDIAETIEGAVLGFFDKAYDEMAGVLSTTRRHTAFLDYRSMRRTLTGHDFDLRDLKRKKMSIYLCLPATKIKANNRWLRIFINQLVGAMEIEETVPDVPVLACLDEMPILGHMKAIEDAAGMLASFHLKFWFVFQDVGQLETLYKGRWQSFLANAGVIQWFANLDLKTTEYVSNLLGKTPVLGLRQGDTSSDQRDKGLSGASESKELHPLLTHDEVSRVFAKTDPLKRQYVQFAGLLPAIIQRVEWFNSDAPYERAFEATSNA